MRWLYCQRGSPKTKLAKYVYRSLARVSSPFRSPERVCKYVGGARRVEKPMTCSAKDEVASVRNSGLPTELP